MPESFNGNTLWSVGRVWGAGLEEIVMSQARQAQIKADRYALQASSLRKLLLQIHQEHLFITL